MPKKNPAKKQRTPAKPGNASARTASDHAALGDVRLAEPAPQESPLLLPKKEEPKLLGGSDNLDAFAIIERAPDRKGNVDSWAEDLVGRRLSVTGRLAVSGWAVDEVAGLPAKAVFVVREGRIVGEAPVGLSRPDVAAAQSCEAYTDSGWTVGVSGGDLGVGDHELEVWALMQDQSSVVRVGGRTVRVCPLLPADPSKQVVLDKIIAKRLLRECAAHGQKWPKMNVDEVSIKDGQLRIRGWALSPAGIARVKVYLDGKLVGACFYGSPRPDVSRSYPFVQESEGSGFTMAKGVDLPDEKLTVCVKVIALDKDGGTQEFEKELPKDDSAALELLRQASDKGDSWAEFKLGHMYKNGTGAPQNYEEAMAWYQKAALRGNLAAESEIAWMILRGQGVAQDTQDALMRFQNLADQNYEWAQVALGTIHRDGIGTPRDSLEAVKWFRLASEQGNQNAKAALSAMGALAG